MMWIAVHLAFAALPFVLTAALYSRKRRFPAGEGDARARDAKARKFYAQLLLVLLLLYHYGGAGPASADAGISKTPDIYG